MAHVEAIHGDSRDVLKAIPSATFHAVVTDPPYSLQTINKRFAKVGRNDKTWSSSGPHQRTARGFMNQKWDTGESAFDPEFWREVGRVMVPGAHLVAFGGTRTSHRMACAIEDAGFEIRDTLAWLYGSGFPKSHAMGKAMDKQRRRDFVATALELGVPLPARSVDDWTKEGHAPGDKWWQAFRAALPPETWEQIERQVIGRGKSGDSAWFAKGAHDITAPATDAAREWEGWGTALKPAYEPIVLARWPMSAKTVAGNLAEHRCGAINVDACRVGTGDDRVSGGPSGKVGDATIAMGGSWNLPGKERPTGSRWPANVVHDGSEEVLAAFPQTMSGALNRANITAPNKIFGAHPKELRGEYEPDSGSAARFFGSFPFTEDEKRFHYSSKADSGDRLQSKHPTVKPVDLMRWLVRLVTPKGGHVLDPFAGSGTTGMACMAEGFDCTLIEREEVYVADIRRRIAHVSGGDTPLFVRAAE